MQTQHDPEPLYDGPPPLQYTPSRMRGALATTFVTADLRPSAAADITSHIGLYKELRNTIKEGSAILRLVRLRSTTRRRGAPCRKPTPQDTRSSLRSRTIPPWNTPS